MIEEVKSLYNILFGNPFEKKVETPVKPIFFSGKLRKLVFQIYDGKYNLQGRPKMKSEVIHVPA